MAAARRTRPARAPSTPTRTAAAPRTRRAAAPSTPTCTAATPPARTAPAPCTPIRTARRLPPAWVSGGLPTYPRITRRSRCRITRPAATGARPPPVRSSAWRRALRSRRPTPRQRRRMPMQRASPRAAPTPRPRQRRVQRRRCHRCRRGSGAARGITRWASTTRRCRRAR